MNTKQIYTRIGIGMILYIALPFLIQLVLYPSLFQLYPELRSNSYIVWILTIAPMYLAGVPVFYLLIKGIRKQHLYRHRLTVFQLMKFITVSFTFLYIGSLIGTGLTKLLSFFTQQESSGGVANMISQSDFPAMLIFVVILPPIMEELVFRKWLLDRLVVMGDKMAIFISALLFGLVHGNLKQFFFAFFIGCIFGYIYIRTGRLRYSILIHLIINFFGSVIAQSVLRNMGEIAGNMSKLVLLLLYSGVLLALFILGLITFILERKKVVLKKGELSESGGKMLASFFSHPVIIMMLIAMVILFIYKF